MGKGVVWWRNRLHVLREYILLGEAGGGKALSKGILRVALGCEA